MGLKAAQVGIIITLGIFAEANVIEYVNCGGTKRRSAS
jgi:hypothetical protein